MTWPLIWGFSIWGFLAAIFAAAWLKIGRRVMAGEPILPMAPRRGVPWSGHDVLFVAAFYIAAYFASARAAVAIAVAWAPAILGANEADVAAAAVRGDNPLGLGIGLLCGMAANLSAALFALCWMTWRNGAVATDFGIDAADWRGDVRLGAIVFAAVAAPVYGLQFALSIFVEERHPIIEVLEREPSTALFALAGLSAVFVAPLAEELFFRVLLQGWLESSRPPLESLEEAAAPVDARPHPAAIFACSLIFAALHLGQGAAPVPLFFLALALGYLYQRTHRLLPCATVHFCLNACSFALLYLSTFNAAGNG